MSAGSAAALAALALAAALVCGTVLPRSLPGGAPRRTAEEAGLILGFAAPALGLLASRLDHWWAAAAVIAAGYGGFYVLRARQLRRADRDGIRRLLGLHPDATFGELYREVERIEPRPLSARGRVLVAVAAVVVVVAGQLLGLMDAAFTGLALGAAESTLRPAYRRALARKVRQIGH